MRTTFPIAFALATITQAFALDAQCEFGAVLPSPLTSNDYMGQDVARSGSRFAVGTAGTNEAIYVYALEGRNWFLEQRIASPYGNGGAFGFRFALDGDEIVSAAISPGILYDFGYDGSSWVLAQTIQPGDAAPFDFFGDDVALQGDRMVVGARGVDDFGTDAGAVYVYDFDGTQWVQSAKLLASDGANADNLGRPIALDGDRFVAGAQGAYVNGQAIAGAAYVFELQGASWVETAKLTLNPPVAGELFPSSLALEGDRILAGSVQNGGTGAVFVFDYDASTGLWNQTQRVAPPSVSVFDQFGVSVSIEGNRMASGATQLLIGPGKVLVLQDDGTGYVEVNTFVAEEAVQGDVVGVSCDLEGNIVAAGGDLHDAGGISNTGGAWTFSIDDSLCPILSVTRTSVSLSEGGTSRLDLDAGPTAAGDFYWIVGSISGTCPGFPLFGSRVPLNPDDYFALTLTQSSLSPLSQHIGTLGPQGSATAAFTIPPASDPSLVGLTVHHAAAVFRLGPLTIDDVSNAPAITLTP